MPMALEDWLDLHFEEQPEKSTPLPGKHGHPIRVGVIAFALAVLFCVFVVLVDGKSDNNHVSPSAPIAIPIRLTK